MKRLEFSLPDKKLLGAVYRFAKDKRVRLYLVGGFLRDLLLGRERQNPDFDFCINSGAIRFGQQLAQKLKAGFVVLDKEHGACRIVKKEKKRICTLDFTDFRGKNLEEDLLHRDFTINTLALELASVFFKNPFDYLVDPCGARDDVAKRVIRVINKDSFLEDPLRILRVFSFSGLLGFSTDSKTLRLARSQRGGLKSIAGERIRDELFKVFEVTDTYKYLELMDRLKILDVLFPFIKKMRGIGQGPYHHLDVWQHTLETIKQFDALVIQLAGRQNIRDFLDSSVSAERTHKAILKLAAFLHDIGKPAALRREGRKIKFHGHERIGAEMSEGVAKSLRLSGEEISALKKIVRHHLRPGYLADLQPLSRRAKFRFFRDSGLEAVGVLLLSIADQRATKGPLTTRLSRLRHEKVCLRLVAEYFANRKEKPARLINGDDLIKVFKLKPSPLIGKILSEIEELQAIGRLKAKEDALRIARDMIRQSPQVSFTD
jgi:poly(A) polymerase